MKYLDPKVLVLVCLLFSSSAFAQAVLTNNGATLTLTPNSSLQLNGSLENKSTGFFNNEGTIVVNGDLQNNASTNLSTGLTGSFILNGAGAQIVSGSSDIFFYNFELNNTSTQGISLGTNIDVAGTLLMTDGDIDLNGRFIDLGITGNLMGETNDNRIYGLTGTINATRDLNAPTALNVAGMGLEITSSANMSTTLLSRGHTIQTAINGNTSIERYFDVTPTNNTALDATLRFHYFDKEIIGHNEPDLLLWRSEDVGLNWENWDGTIVTSSNFLDRSGIEDMYRWTLSDAINRPLPVELVYFTAKVNSREQVELDWETAVEINNDFFIVQRSRNAVDFEDVGKVDAAGDAQVNIHYDLLDENPYKGYSYYRLMIVDNDGGIEYSEIRTVIIGSNEISVFPNPILFYDDLHIIGLTIGSYDLTVHDAAGKHLFTKSILSTSHSQEHKLTLPRLAGGAYTYTISSQTKSLKNGILIVINSEN